MVPPESIWMHLVCSRQAKEIWFIYQSPRFTQHPDVSPLPPFRGASCNFPMVGWAVPSWVSTAKTTLAPIVVGSRAHGFWQSKTEGLQNSSILGPSQSEMGRKLFGDFFFKFVFFFGFPVLTIFHAIPCYLQHFGAGNCHFHGMCNGFEFEPLIFHCIFHGICNSLQHVLSIFHALCSIFELESAFPPYVQHFTATFLTVLAGFWSCRLTFQQLFVVTVTVVGVGVVVVGGVVVVVGGGGGRVVAVVVAVVSVNVSVVRVVSVVSVASVVLVLC